MSRITVMPHAQFCPQGAEFETDSAVTSGSNLCQMLLDHGVKIEHACDMAAACTTCHVIVRQGFNTLDEMDDVEADLLDRAWGLEPDSRLSCQIKKIESDLVIEIPRYTINHASEKH